MISLEELTEKLENKTIKLVDESEVLRAVIEYSLIQYKNYDYFKEYVNVLDHFKEAGLGIAYYKDLVNNNYDYCVFVKKVGFIK